jgi:hypothetical protein
MSVPVTMLFVKYVYIRETWGLSNPSARLRLVRAYEMRGFKPIVARGVSPQAMLPKNLASCLVNAPHLA